MSTRHLGYLLHPAGLGKFAAVILAAALGILSGCSGKPPEIARVIGEPVLIHDTGTGSYAEKLSMFMVATDPDGMEDLANLYVINDDAQLYWTVDSKSWITAAAEGESWIGSNGFSIPDGAPFPAGTYRAVLEDVGGNTIERTFTLPADIGDPSRASYPTATVKDNAIQVSSVYSGQEVWVFTREGRFLLRFAADPSAIPLTLDGIAADYPDLRQGFTYWAFSFDSKDGYALMTGPYSSGALQPK
jgi:hypothetical protein